MRAELTTQISIVYRRGYLYSIHILRDQYQIKQIVQDMLMRKLFGTNNFCYLEIMKIEYAEQLIAIENLRARSNLSLGIQ